MLTRLDDYPVHQTPEPVTHPSTGDRNFYDRYFFNGYTADGSLFFAVAMGLYPNRRVMDAAFSVVVDGKQHNLRASRRAPWERTETEVAPVRLEVVEPMETLRIVVAPNDHGIEADLTFRARTVALEEPRFRRHSGARITFDVTRFAQFGSWEGWISVGGARTEVRPDVVLGCRDRSWGVRGVGEPEGGAPPDQPVQRQFYWLWAPINWPDGATHFGRNDDADGVPWHENAVVAPLLHAGEPERMVRSDVHVDWAPGTRHAASATLAFEARDGRKWGITLAPVLTFAMHGIGYGAGDWGHGRWVGEHQVAYDTIDLAAAEALDPRYLHIQALCRAERTDPDGSLHQGIGVLEQLVLGPHAPSGFRDVLDGASG